MTGLGVPLNINASGQRLEVSFLAAVKKSWLELHEPPEDRISALQVIRISHPRDEMLNQGSLEHIYKIQHVLVQRFISVT